jgi:hypothetical protein
MRPSFPFLDRRVVLWRFDGLVLSPGASVLGDDVVAVEEADLAIIGRERELLLRVL